jgi:hypothetical protein
MTLCLLALAKLILLRLSTFIILRPSVQKNLLENGFKLYIYIYIYMCVCRNAAVKEVMDISPS